MLAGFLWLVPEYILAQYAGRIINIHPALLPKYGGKGMYGMKVHEAVKAAGGVQPAPAGRVQVVDRKLESHAASFRLGGEDRPGDRGLGAGVAVGGPVDHPRRLEIATAGGREEFGHRRRAEEAAGIRAADLSTLNRDGLVGAGVARE